MLVISRGNTIVKICLKWQSAQQSEISVNKTRQTLQGRLYPKVYLLQTLNTLFWDFKCSSTNIIEPPARECSREYPRYMELSSTYYDGDKQSYRRLFQA